MKLRSLACSLTLSSLLTLPLLAQDQTAATSPAAPLQLQENPVPAPASTPAPAVDTNAAAPVTQAAPADTNAPVAPGTNAPTDTNAAPVDPNAPAPNSGMGSPGQNPPPSDPNSLIPPPMEPEAPSPINTAGNAEKQRQDQKARYYIVKVKADKDEDLVSLQDKAENAKSDEAKRQALREYYDLLAKRMKKIDSGLSDWIDTMHAAYLRRLDQIRVEPTVPLNPPPTPDGAASPSPSPSPSSTPHHRRHSGTKANASSPTPTPSSKKKAEND